MDYFLSRDSVLKWLEAPSVYQIKNDELFELDDESFEFLKRCRPSKEHGIRDLKSKRRIPKEFISKAPSPSPSPARGEGCKSSPPLTPLEWQSLTGLTGGDEGEGDVCGFTNNLISKSGNYSKKTLASFIAYCKREGILTGEITVVNRPPLIKSPVPSLRYLELQITDKCNLRCKHCYIGNNVSTELSVKQTYDIFREFEDMQGLRVLITGGEPLVHSRFVEINEMLPDFFFRKVLFSNGLLLKKKILKTLKVDEIQISIDGLEHAHDALRGTGSFQAAMKALKLTVESGIDVSVSTMALSGNLEDFDKMESLFHNLGIREWNVDVPCITGRLKDYPEFQLSPKQAGQYLRYGYGGGLHGSSQGFGCGLHLMSVTADGRAAKCTFYSDRTAGGIEDGLKKCWKKIKPVRLDELKCDCKHIETCRGGCRYRAELLGDPKGKDLYRCSLYGYNF